MRQGEQTLIHEPKNRSNDSAL